MGFTKSEPFEVVHRYACKRYKCVGLLLVRFQMQNFILGTVVKTVSFMLISKKWISIKLLSSEIVLTFKRLIVLGQVYIHLSVMTTQIGQCTIKSDKNIVSTLKSLSNSVHVLEVTGAVFSNLIGLSSQSIVHSCLENHRYKLKAFDMTIRKSADLTCIKWGCCN